MSTLIIIGIIKNHMRLCNMDNCPCKNIFFDEEESPIKVCITDTSGECKAPYNKNVKDKDTYNDELIYEVLNNTLKNIKHKQNNGQIYIMEACISYAIMDKVFLALHNLMLIQEYELSYLQRYLVFTIKFIL